MFEMVDSCLSVRASSSSLISQSKALLYLSNQISKSLKISFLIPFLLISFVFFCFPDEPQHLASICQRHNSKIACTVW